MKKLIFTCCAIFSLSLLANEPIKLEGNFTYSGVELSQIRDIEIVPSSNNDRYKELVAIGFQCFLRGNFFSCQKFIKNESLPVILEKEITQTWTGINFDFISRQEFPTNTNESESLYEWDIHDTVKFNNQTVEDYHYYLLKDDQDIHKIVMKFVTGEEWLIVQSEKRVSSFLEKRIHSSKFTSRIYSVLLNFDL
jgi:hypothetical protein